MSKWIAANNGGGKRIWFLVREDESEYRWAANGRLIRYATHESATRMADRLNREEAKS